MHIPAVYDRSRGRADNVAKRNLPWEIGIQKLLSITPLNRRTQSYKTYAFLKSLQSVDLTFPFVENRKVIGSCRCPKSCPAASVIIREGILKVPRCEINE